jgi:septum formation protein
MSAFSFIYLASQSPRRQALLDQIGVAHQVLLPADAEAAEALEAVLPHESALRYVKRVTRLKVLAAMAQIQQQSLISAPVLCADTTVVVDRHILGKPANASEATQMLSLLSGKTHQVLTAVAIGHNQDIHLALSRSRVKFAPMTAADIQDYVASQEPMGKAGAYAIQGRASVFISHVSGSYSGIMGLPLYETAQLLQQAGLPLP